ncbi:MAG: hypothetical protein WBC71_03465 [Salaquimonas sp.]
MAQFAYQNCFQVETGFAPVGVALREIFSSKTTETAKTKTTKKTV